MKKTSKIASILLVVSISAYASEDDIRPMTMGDGVVRGERVNAYEFTWLQCTKQDDGWFDAGPLTESFVSVGSESRLTQRTTQSNGVASRSTTFFARASMAPLRMEQAVTGPDGEVLASSSRVLNEDGYSGTSRRGDQVTDLGGSVSSNMWHGNALGLVLATIDPSSYPVEFASSMIAFDGTYRTIATLAGRETMDVRGKAVEVLLVDVEWHHNETGDVYPPGPNASGGRYWLVPDPPAGIPYVPQYRTDTYLVSTLLKDCPEIT